MSWRLGPALPALVMALGAGLLLGVDRQETALLREPLSVVPLSIMGQPGKDRAISAEEQRVAGMSDYLFREFGSDSLFAFSVYVGYYREQTQGRTIHSPRNCLPGAGWEPMEVSDRVLEIGGRQVTVRRYLLAKQASRALVYYWYQGRGRISSNEYKVKWELLRDAALRGRTEEALVRIVLPLSDNTASADSIAAGVAAAIVPAVDRALPLFR